MEAIKPLAKSTARSGSDAGLGGFGALFDLRAAGYRDPLLVSTTDGVGTKLKVAIDTGRHDTVGIDLVAMCVNDLLAQGAEPLLFLDYFATGKLSVEAGRQIVAGVAEGCRQAGCALVGGETAEMPGMYRDGDYDLAGFSVGAVERSAVLTGDKVGAGDTVLGLASTGVHSNGFSLVRRLVEISGLGYEAPAPWDSSRSLGEALLTPTRIYVKSLLAAIRTGGVHAVANITGGGLWENIPRVLPAGLGVDLDAARWPLLPVFSWLKSVGNVDNVELARAFNVGLGMVVVVETARATEVAEVARAGGETVFEVGRVVPVADGAKRVTVAHMAETWGA